jgi:hypothetical protein
MLGIACLLAFAWTALSWEHVRASTMEVSSATAPTKAYTSHNTDIKARIRKIEQINKPPSVWLRKYQDIAEALPYAVEEDENEDQAEAMVKSDMAMRTSPPNVKNSFVLSSKRVARLILLVCSLCYASNYSTTKHLQASMKPMLVTFFRFLIGSLCFLPTILGRSLSSHPLPRELIARSMEVGK